jgi:hypothetical protein
LVDGAKPIWVTECGATTASTSEADQDNYLKSTLAPSTGVLRGDASVAVTFWYELNDAHYPPSKDDGWGLTYGSDRNYLPKQAYNTFKNFLALQTATMPTATPHDSLDNHSLVLAGDRGFYAVVKRDRTVLV